MNLLTALFEALAALFGARQSVRGYNKSQAYGPGWSKHRPRRIGPYRRRRSRAA